MALRTLVSTASRRGSRAYAATSVVSSEAVISTSNSGMKIGCITKSGDTATVTAWVDAGSRYETPQTNGVAQLFETTAMASKSAEIAALGGMVSSYTSREFIVFEAKVLKENVEAATKLLGEMVGSKPSDVSSAKDAMLAKLDAVHLSPEQVLMEHLHDAAYLDTAMGQSVLGTPESVSALSAQDVNNFARDHITTKRTVVSAAGNIDASAFAKMVESSFSGVSTAQTAPKMQKASFTGSDKRMRFDNKPVADIAVVFEGASHSSSDKIPLQLMAAYLGEINVKDNNTILSKNSTSWLRSDQAPTSEQGSGGPITLNIINESYHDSGIFGIQYQAYDNNIEEAMYFNLYNLVRLVHHATDEDVSFAKLQLKTSLGAKMDTTCGLASQLAQAMSTQNGMAMSKSELMEAIDKVDLATFKAVADKVINDQDHALAATGPIHELPDYNWIRRRSFWLRY